MREIRPKEDFSNVITKSKVEEDLTEETLRFIHRIITILILKIFYVFQDCCQPINYTEITLYTLI